MIWQCGGENSERGRKVFWFPGHKGREGDLVARRWGGGVGDTL